jgi:nitrogen fixation NifU-like protein
MDLRELYQEVILDHGRRPRNFGALDDATHSAEGDNPLCGDHLNVYVRIEDEHIVEVCFDGAGCAISTASASLMTEALTNQPVAAFPKLFDAVHTLCTGGEADLDDLGKLRVFGGVSAFPLRVKCATLSWHTLRAALRGSEAATTE